MIWHDNKALRDAQAVDRMGTVLVFSGSYYLPNMREGALVDKAITLFEEEKPDLEKIEKLLDEAVELQPRILLPG